MDSARAQALPDGPEKPRIQRISLHFSTLVYRSKKADSSPSSDLDFPWEGKMPPGRRLGPVRIFIRKKVRPGSGVMTGWKGAANAFASHISTKEEKCR
ncbi:hypothetical protein B5E53_05825 [Eubacterium sp. An11]|nr:hypothetical protein B5E53_05825 [Eubacterium sp. An11]